MSFMHGHKVVSNLVDSIAGHGLLPGGPVICASSLRCRISVIQGSPAVQNYPHQRKGDLFYLILISSLVSGICRVLFIVKTKEVWLRLQADREYGRSDRQVRQVALL